MQPIFLPGEEVLNSDYPFSLEIHHLTRNVTPHGHNFIEFTYVFKGYGIEIINGIEHELRPGTLTLLFPHQVHEIIVDTGEQVELYVGAIGLKAFFSADDTVFALNRILMDVESDLTSFYYLNDETGNQVFLLLRQMHSELLEEQVWNRIMFKAKLAEVLVLTYRHRNMSKDKSSSSSGSRRQNNILTIVHYVYKNFKEDISLESLSRQFFLSVPHLSSSFKKFCGENFHNFLERIRIAHACSLLISSELSITDISFEVGFKSYTTFSRVFLKNTKMSPSSYRQLKSISLKR